MQTLLVEGGKKKKSTMKQRQKEGERCAAQVPSCSQQQGNVLREHLDLQMFVPYIICEPSLE